MLTESALPGRKTTFCISKVSALSALQSGRGEGGYGVRLRSALYRGNWQRDGAAAVF